MMTSGLSAEKCVACRREPSLSLMSRRCWSPNVVMSPLRRFLGPSEIFCRAFVCAQAADVGFRRVRAAHENESAEDYVELIAELIRVMGEARVVDLAERLGVAHATVSKTVGRLAKKGLVTSEPYRSIFLTAKGQQLASRVRQRHELVVRFLRQLGVAQPIAEADAEGIEHHVSPETLAAMENFVRSRATPRKAERSRSKDNPHEKE